MTEEDICRYCFEGAEDGPLISPCKCAGGQKYVHLSCLRRWQRRVLVSQPTHPAFYEDDVRHHRCNVCLSEYTCAPPSRGELMASFTGPELAALIEKDCIIASHDVFASHLREQLETIPEFLWDRLSYHHWIDGVYLITEVEAEEGTVTIPMEEQGFLDSFRHRLGEDLTISIRGRKLKVAAKESLEGVQESDLAEALAELKAPATVVMEVAHPAGCAEDHIAAVNLARPVAEAPDKDLVREALAGAQQRAPGCDSVEVAHFLGGPCGEDKISCCVVYGGNGSGWTVVDGLAEAVALAHTRVSKTSEAQGSVVSGQTVRLHGLQSAQALNGQLGLTLTFEEQSGRWLVRLMNGEGKRVKPANLEGMKGGSGRVLAFWGNAQWSRAQLLGEIARGSWGMCRAGVSELIQPVEFRRRGLDGRLAFAPITEMSDDYIKDAQQQMETYHIQAQVAGDTAEPHSNASVPTTARAGDHIQTDDGSDESSDQLLPADAMSDRTEAQEGPGQPAPLHDPEPEPSAAARHACERESSL